MHLKLILHRTIIISGKRSLVILIKASNDYILCWQLSNVSFTPLYKGVNEGEKNHKKGGWIVFSKTFLPLRSEELFSGSESEVVQSLSEFRVLVQWIISKKAERERTQAIIQVHSTQERDFSVLKDNSKRLLCSITQEWDFYAQGQFQETSFAQSQLKETYLNNYKELNKVLNTWYTIRGIHNTIRTEQTLFYKTLKNSKIWTIWRIL